MTIRTISLLLFLLPLAILTLSGCLNTISQEDVTIEKEPINTSNWKSYTNEEYGFSLEYPEGWEYEERNDELMNYELGRVSFREASCDVGYESKMPCITKVFISYYEPGEYLTDDVFQDPKKCNVDQIPILDFTYRLPEITACNTFMSSDILKNKYMFTTDTADFVLNVRYGDESIGMWKHDWLSDVEKNRQNYPVERMKKNDLSIEEAIISSFQLLDE